MQWLISLLTGPIISGAIDAYKAKLAAGNTSEKLAAELAGRELEVQKAEIEAQSMLRVAMIGKWYEPTQLACYIIVFYLGKVIIWDKVLGWGTTDAITGDVGNWAGAIIMFMIGKRGFENVARILRK